MKNKSLSIELSHENTIGDGYFYATLDLPATDCEIRDAIQQVRMFENDDTFRSVDIIYCSVWSGLVYYRLDSPTIAELNFFAKRLAQMDDRECAIFKAVASKLLGNPSDTLLSMKDLINCTYGYDEIMIAANIANNEQLGQFIIENELHDDINAIPESSLYLLDKEKIGELYRESLNCTLSNEYAVFIADYRIPEVYDGKQLPNTEIENQYAFRLQIAPSPTEDVSEVEDKSLWITLPMKQKEIDRIVKELGVGSIKECVYLDFVSTVPQIAAEQFGNMQDFQKLNALAEQLSYLSPLEQAKFKAALTAEEPKDIDGVRDVFDNLEWYELNAYADSDDDFFKDYLEHHLDSRFDRTWLDTVLLKTEASKLLDRLGATNTDYGVISARNRSLYELVPYDKQPIKEPSTQSLTDEKLDVIEVLGQTGLFTNARVTEQELPEGLYKYDLREGEALYFSSIEPNVIVNHVGTVLLKSQIDFGNEKYIAFDDDTTPNFLGYELTPREFMNIDFTQTENEEETVKLQMGEI